MNRNPSGPPSPSYRPDIDGLRAISILLVVAFHAFPKLLAGGYLGVDVFFVISGYLITQLVTRESGRDRFSLATFYARRVRRLFPALFLVTTACLGFGWFALLPDEYALLGKHALAGALFVPNLAFWSEAGYWDTSSELKPLLHLWSIGVEEQFYLVWPAFVLLLLRRRLSVPTWVIPLALLSFVAGLPWAGTSGVGAFFLPQFRMWELMLGGLVAHLSGATRGDGGDTKGEADSTAPSSALLANAQSLIGLALVLAAAVVFEGDGNHSAWSALTPAIGSAMVIGAGASALLNRIVLGNRAMVALGRISYPLYLWHWPLLSFVTIVESGSVTPQWRLALVGISFVLATLTYRFVEIPVRALTGRRGVWPLVLLYLGAGAVGGLVYAQAGLPLRTRTLAAQLDAFEWESKGLFLRDDCSQALGLGGSRCLSNGKPHQVAVIGDSYSTNMFFVLQEFYRDSETGVVGLGKAGCLPFYGIERYADGMNQGCRDTMNRDLDYALSDPQIRTVVFALRAWLYFGDLGGNRLIDGNPAPRRNTEIFRTAMEATIRRFIDAGKDVIYVLDWPQLDFNPKKCVDVRPLRLRPFQGMTCAIDRSRVEAFDAAYREMVLQSFAGLPHTRLWDPRKILCDEARCWAMKDGVMLYRDDHHLSLAGSEYLGKRFVAEDPPRR